MFYSYKQDLKPTLGGRDFNHSTNLFDLILIRKYVFLNAAAVYQGVRLRAKPAYVIRIWYGTEL